MQLCKFEKSREAMNDYEHNQTLKFVSRKFGSQVEQFELNHVFMSRHVILKMLKQMMPKLKILKISYSYHHYISDEESDQIVTLPKLEVIKMCENDSDMYEILDYLETPNINRAKFYFYHIKKVELYVKKYESNIKYLSLESFEENQLDLLPKLKNMHLEHLNMYVGNWGSMMFPWRNDGNVMQKFLKLQTNLKFLCLQRVCVSNEYLQIAIDLMPNLESLILKDGNYSQISRSVTSNLYKLTKLKKLVIDLADNYKFGEFQHVNVNYLSGLKSNVYLEELESFFPDNVPNLKKLRMKTRSHRVIEHVLRYFRNLEELQIEYYTYQEENQPQFSLDEKVLLKLKHLHLQDCQFRMNTKVARKLVNNFPNLEYLKIDSFVGLTARCVKILLRGMKRLKDLDLEDGCSDLIPMEKVDELVFAYGKSVMKIQTPHSMATYRTINWFPYE
jgi:hypothetical protein